MRKSILAGVVVIAALGLGAGLIQMEKRAFDDALRSLAEEAPEGISIDTDVTASNFFSTEFSVRIAETSGAWGVKELAARWSGRATFGFGTVVRASLDDRRDLGRLLAEYGVAGFRDELLIKWAPWKSTLPVSWRTAGFDFLPDSSLACTVEPLRFEGELKDGRFVRFDWTGEGVGCNTRGRAIFALKNFATHFAEKEAPSQETLAHLAPLYPVETSLQIGALSGETFDFKNIAFSGKLEKAAAASQPKKTTQAEGEAPEVRWCETIEGSVETPVFEKNLLGERAAMKMRLEGLTQTLADNIVGLNMAILATGDESLLTAGAIKVFEDAFMRGGLAWHIDDLSLERQGERAIIAGAFAFKGDPEADREAAFDPTRGVPLGALSVAIPASMVGAREAAPFVKSGAAKLEDGIYRSHIELTTVGITANGGPVF